MSKQKSKIKIPRDTTAVSLRHFKAKVVPSAKKVESKSACRKWKSE
jgi:hypothetical protein